MRTPPKSSALTPLAAAGQTDAHRNAQTQARHNPGLQDLASIIRDAKAGHPASPTREVLARLGDEWSVLLLSVLETGSYRNAELRRAVNDMNRLVPKAAISQRMLALRLRSLERDGLVVRSTGEETCASVHYRLSPLGQGLMRRLQGVLQWSVENAGEIRSAQSRFDERDRVHLSGIVHRSR